MNLCNLLMPDPTAYSVLTVWHEAVAAIHQTLIKGDILVLSCCKVASLRTDHSNLMHNMPPKVGGAGYILSAIENSTRCPSDLGCVFHLDRAAICDSVPLPIKIFTTVQEMSETWTSPSPRYNYCRQNSSLKKSWIMRNLSVVSLPLRAPPSLTTQQTRRKAPGLPLMEILRIMTMTMNSGG